MIPRLSRFALTLTRSRPDADDLVQMTCERALNRADQWQPDTRIDSWMYRIMQTIWLNEVQSRGVRTRYQEAQAPAEEQSEDGAALADSRLELKEVARTLFGLPEQERAVLLMVCVDGLTYRETAEVLNIPIGTVMSRLARARLKLVENLSANGPSSGNIVRLTSHDHDR